MKTLGVVMDFEDGRECSLSEKWNVKKEEENSSEIFLKAFARVCCDLRVRYDPRVSCDPRISCDAYRHAVS